MFAKQIPAERATHICQVLQGMPEKLRRQYAAREAMQLGYGGISAVSKLTNISIPTIKKGLKEIQAGDIYQIGDRNRREGGGRRKASETFRKQVEKKNQQEGIQLETDINKVVNTILLESTYGNPAQTGRYTNITPGKVANEVNSKYGSNLSVPTFERVFINLGYSLQQNAKLEQVGKQHPLRDEQFRYREEIVEVYRSKNLPIISCDTKAKVKLGPFACKGREWRLIRDPRKKEDHDYAKFFREIYPNGNENLDDYFYSKYAIIAPYGVYCFNNNTGYVSLGISSDTSLFSANSIFNWWESSGKQNFPNAEELLVLVDGGGSNRSSGFLWKDCMADIAIRMNLRSIQIFHHPPGASKWNFVEHSLFNHISKNWNAKSKDDLEILRNYIIHTTTTTGLVVDCDIDYNIYLTEAQKKQQLRDSNIKISSLETAEERFFKKAHLEFFHDDPTMRQWNYKIVID